MRKTTQSVKKFSKNELTVEAFMEFVSDSSAPLNARIRTYSGIDHRQGGFTQEITLVWDVE